MVAEYSISDLPERLAKHIVVNAESGCWEWQMSSNEHGYCQIKWNDRYPLVHRLVYTLLVGPIPDGLTLDHVKARGCRFRHCCWPTHLEPVTNQVNILRGDTLAAANAAKTHCPAGHEYTPENTYISSTGKRSCRQCNLAAVLRYQATHGRPQRSASA